MALKGIQTPTTCVYLSSTEDLGRSLGSQACELYDKTGNTTQEWQRLMLDQILAVNEDNLWVHTKFGYSIPRRNGKSEIILMRILFGLMNGEKILYTAHRTTTSHSFFERCDSALASLGFIKAHEARKQDEVPEEELYDSYKANGLEALTLRLTGGKVSFRTRTSKGGLGEGFDLLIIDEAQEYQDDQESSLKYVVTDSKNPQTLFCGTPPTAVSSGTVFQNMRKNVLAGNARNSGWAEWAVEEKTDPNDTDAWVRTNPSLGYVFTERSIEDEVGSDDVDFNIQRLGLWFTYNQASAIPEEIWSKTKAEQFNIENLKGKLYVGIKFGKDGNNTALSIACKTTDDKVFVQSLYCKPTTQGVGWIIDLLGRLDYAEVICDGKNGQQMIEDAMKDAKLKHLTLPTVAQVINANAVFEQAVFQNGIVHTPQQTLDTIVTNCKKRNIGSNGGFGYESLIQDMDIAILDSVIYAYAFCAQAKERKPQKMIY